MMGRICRQKNMLNAVLAFQDLQEQKNCWNLVIFGDGEDYDMLKTIANGSSSVTLRPWQSKIDYENFRYIIFPSYYEGSPNALLEAVSEGLIPIVTPFKSGGKELIEDFGVPSITAKGFKREDIYKALCDVEKLEPLKAIEVPVEYRRESLIGKLMAALRS